MKILFLASEVDPFAKTGGLADVAGALPKALAALGHDIRIVMPLYRQIDRAKFGLREAGVTVIVSVGPRRIEARVWTATLPKSAVTVHFIESAALFDRDGLYQERGKDYPDNLTRFSVFAQASLRMLPSLRWQPEVVHGHDWQAALACAHLARGPLGQEPFFASMAPVFTVHNLAYQGLFPREQWGLTQLPEPLFAIDGLEFYGQVNCLKGGLIGARGITTVSPTYAQEIQTAEFGCGLDGLLRARREDLTGILNGIDVEEWNPQTDPHLAARYAVEERAGKSLCKLALQQSQRLPEQHDLLIGMIQRLAEQKGIDLLVGAMEELMKLPVQLVILGTGDPVYHQQLERLAKRFPDRLAVNLTFDNALAHQIEAGADAFLMPSRFEPCGLNQMYSMRFGTVPIVRRVGGLADTVVDVTPAAKASKTATGFVFEEHSSRALLEAVKRTVTAFNDHPLWTLLMQTGMRQDFSWGRSARAYADVYERALHDHHRHPQPLAR
ncbi:MAG: glycogen synthase GlgA [Candidatus Omnitrophica bacterium]|nr:glycogen synthase GlgA [Candidatus Omnitrophota bacterium]